MSIEKWVPVEYQGVKLPSFEVSNFGKISKVKGRKREFIYTDTSKRRSVSLTENRKHVRTAAARVFYCSFHKVVIPKGLIVDHVDNDFRNDSIKNLQLLTNEDNVKKYHAWKKTLNIKDPFEGWIKGKTVTLRRNNLYDTKVVCLGMYPTIELANLAVNIAKEVIKKYKVKNNDKIAIIIINEIKDFRKSINIDPVSRYGAMSSKKIMHGTHLKGLYKYVYSTKPNHFK